MFVKHDAVLKPLWQPYDGPYKVLKCTDKHFTLQIKDREEVVSVDRLKPAFTDNLSPLQINHHLQTFTTLHYIRQYQLLIQDVMFIG